MSRIEGRLRIQRQLLEDSLRRLQIRALRRGIGWVCRRHARRKDAVGDCARRVLRHDPTPDTFADWRVDLEAMLSLAWAVNDFGFYTAPTFEQSAALDLRDALDELDPTAFMNRLKEEGAA